MRDDASVLEGAAQAGMRLARVPGVEGAVSVIVVEVVGLPRHRRENDGDVILAESSRPENEGCVADLAASCDELGEVEPAWPLAYSNPDRASRSNSPEAPSGGHGGSEHCVLRADGSVLCACAENLEGHLGATCPEHEPREVPGGVALSRECSLDGRPVGWEQSLRAAVGTFALVRPQTASGHQDEDEGEERSGEQNV